jgi:hypothetical protein
MTQRGREGSKQEGSSIGVAAVKQSIGRLALCWRRHHEASPLALESKATPHPLPVGGMGGNTCCVCASLLTRKILRMNRNHIMISSKLVSHILEIFSQNIGGLK